MRSNEISKSKLSPHSLGKRTGFAKKVILCVLLVIAILLIITIAALFYTTNLKSKNIQLKPFSNQSEPLVQSVNDVQKQRADKNQLEPNETQVMGKNLYKEALSFLEEDQFDKAWPKLERALDADPTNATYRRAWVILQKLSSKQYDITSIQKFLKGDFQNMRVDGTLREAENIGDSLNDIIIEDDIKFTAFLQAKKRLAAQIDELIRRIKNIKDINMSISSARKAFEQGNYEQELFFFNKAGKLNWPDQAQLVQCKLFVDGLRLFGIGQYEEAEKTFSKIEKADRHYLTAQHWRERIKQKVLERDFGKQLDEAWRKLDWTALEELTTEIEKKAILEKSPPLAKLLENTKEILQKRKLYLSAKAKSDFYKMAELLKQIDEDLKLATVSDNKKGQHLKAQKWVKTEWNSLIPRAKAKITSLIQNANDAWKGYKKNPIIDDEIDSWTATSNYAPVMTKVDYLQSAHQKLSDANELAKIIGQESATRKLLQEVESEIHGRCRKAFNRAYILEVDYGGGDTAEKIYEVVAAMPAFEGNDYPNKAYRRLENLRKRGDKR